MHARLARQILERERDVPQILVAGAAVDERLQRFRAVSVFEVVALLVFAGPGLLKAKVQRALREQLGNNLRFCRRESEDAGHVSHHGLRLEHTVGNDLPHAIITVLVGHVLDNAAAVPIRDVGIDIRHGNALGVQETFEEQIELERVNVGNADNVSHKRASCGTTSRPHGNPVFTRPVDKVPHDQEVARHVHVADTVQLLVHALGHVGLVRGELEIFVGETPLEAFVTKVGNVDIGIATRFAPAVRILFPSLVVLFGKEFRLGQAIYFGLVFVGKRVRFNTLLGAILLRDFFLLVLDYTLTFAFANYRILRIVFGLHVSLDFLIFLGGEEFFGNLEARPEIVANARLDGKVAAFRNLDCILDGARDMAEQLDHLLFGAEIELVRGETRVRKVVESRL